MYLSLQRRTYNQIQFGLLFELIQPIKAVCEFGHVSYFKLSSVGPVGRGSTRDIKRRSFLSADFSPSLLTDWFFRQLSIAANDDERLLAKSEDVLQFVVYFFCRVTYGAFFGVASN
jgi:hypothetical protein